ncbi:1-hydroxycarotenoid 3,4-desaturase CrtD [Tabrizicola sp.]|uniref:1-hydroxycarotenoid 3,4-desaturase CrtD n=1 Tax=Tabrizicola sp. TaxID=2005166 RepID=UPI00286AE461|nr:1-hydroxycarotenoid 3,4-desaturase CrtD [Tabrizicola sp.]
MNLQTQTVVVIGAGVGGLAAAIRLAAAGAAVTLVEAAATPGGKMRTLPSAAGPVDAGPTVLTLRHVFDDLFALAGTRLEDHLTLIPQPILARHWWPDGSRLDLHADPDATLAAIETFAGPREAQAFRRFDQLSARLFKTFDIPVMQAASPNLGQIARAALRQPRLWPALMPGMTLTRLLRLHFRDPRLIQLFARYATYVGGRPSHSPAVLSLIWRAEAQGVWAVQGGMHQLALALATQAQRLGVRIRYATRASRIVTQHGRVTGVQIEGGSTLPCTACVFNGDPAALTQGLLGTGPASAVAPRATAPRSLSAWVWSFAATPQGDIARNLIHHNVFFSADPKAEFGPIGRGQMPVDPSLYLCAEDRAAGPPARPLERFEIIVNGPAGHPATGHPAKGHPAKGQEFSQCTSRTFDRLQAQGLTFSPQPQAPALTTPAMLGQLFPGSQGAIYGRSPEGLMAAFQRPPATTALAGLYLAGGGAHPGAGVPMAALSGRHAAEAIARGPTSR